MKHKLIKSPYGFYSIKDLPTKEFLENYYAQKYYQDDAKSHAHQYSSDEVAFFQHKAQTAEYIIAPYNLTSLLDVGAGEGFFSAYFFQKGWDVTTLDYSDYGIQQHNQELLNTLVKGDVFESLEELFQQHKTFDFINLSHVLEHLLDPISLLKQLHTLLSDNAVLRISVPNDFSNFQRHLKELNLTEESWVAYPDHLHYFTFESLGNLLESLDYEIVEEMGEFPIEMFLANKSSNYFYDRERGKDAHKSRVLVDNFLFNEGIEKYVDYYRAAAKIGFSRQVVIFAKKRVER
jgi:2-polyprenyl-3-methyl-5-hydroxy-6-metoxy-1,4-benzoquinol methylase